MNQPLIGITTSVGYSQTSGIKRLSAYEKNVVALERAGAIPVMIPCTLNDDTLRGLYDRLDGVLLPGGGDMDSKYWDEPVHETVTETDDARDHTEVMLARWAVAEDRPLFGICRGHQVFNVALGGSLHQDIASFVPSDLQHANFTPTPRDLRAHTVTIDPNTRLAGIIGQADDVPVNSIHHQVVNRVAPGMVVSAQSPDGLVEGLEIPDKRFALSVQWHPEDLTEDERMFNLFKAFVAAAREG